MESVTMEAVGITTGEWIALLEVGDTSKPERRRVACFLWPRSLSNPTLGVAPFEQNGFRPARLPK